MSWKGLFVAVFSAVLLGGGAARVEGQAAGPGIEDQIRAQYRITRVGGNGAVVGPVGSVLVVQTDGISAIPASHGPYWYNVFKKGGDHPRTSGIQHGGSVGNSERRPFQVGEKAYLLNIEINQGEVAFSVQSCGECDASNVDSNNPPYRARLAIEFEKGFLSSGNFKQVQDRIGNAFAIDAGASASSASAGQHPPAAAPASAPAPVATPALNQTVESGPAQDVLQNQDIIDLVGAGLDDATILAKIASSKCQFDTSTSALIKLKQSKVSAAVIKAMVGKGK
jgi:hypothetical protein